MIPKMCIYPCRILDSTNSFIRYLKMTESEIGLTNHIPHYSDKLTGYGNHLSACGRGIKKIEDFDEKKLSQSYEKNINRWNTLKRYFSKNQWVILIGPGKINAKDLEIINMLQKTGKATLACTQRCNFHPNIEIDLLISPHVLPLMASLYHTSTPKAIIHGVYDSTPPVISSSCTMAWGDPYLVKTPVKAENMVRFFNKYQDAKKIPFIPSPRNVMTFSLFTLLFLGIKRISMLGFDPLNPQYFYADDPMLRLHIAECYAKCDPWISAWDGRHQRLPPTVSTVHNQLFAISNLVINNTVSAVGSGWRLEEIHRGIELSISVANELGVKLEYIGHSDFMYAHKLENFKL